MLWKAAKGTNFNGVKKEDIIKELVINGIAWFLSIIVTFLLHGFLEERSIKNLGGLIKPKDKIMVDKTTFAWVNWILIFIVGLIVFTFVERMLENYFNLKKRSKE